MRVAVLFACLLAGCAVSSEASAPATVTASGAAAPVAPTAAGAGGESVASAEQQIVFDDHATLTMLATEIEAMARAEDCASACEGGERLCALSERICGIADRHPHDAEIGARCTDGRERCRIARERLATACGCASE